MYEEPIVDMGGMNGARLKNENLTRSWHCGGDMERKTLGWRCRCGGENFGYAYFLVSKKATVAKRVYIRVVGIDG